MIKVYQIEKHIYNIIYLSNIKIKSKFTNINNIKANNKISLKYINPNQTNKN